MIQQEARNKRVSSASRFGDSFSGKYQSGFTLVEIMVVMTMIAIMMTLMAWSMISAGKQVRLRDAAKTLQSDIRKAANNSISVAPDINGTPAKAWDINFDTTQNSQYYLSDFTAGTASPNNSKSISFDNNITFLISDPAVTDKLHLIFSSPFAKFNATTGDTVSWLDPDSETEEILPSSNVLPAPSKIIIYVSDDQNKIPVTIDVKTGESSVGTAGPI